MMKNNNVQYFGEKIIPLIGAKVTGIADGGDDEFGLIVKKNGKETVLLVQQDAEGNGPGWLTIQES